MIFCSGIGIVRSDRGLECFPVPQSRWASKELRGYVADLVAAVSADERRALTTNQDVLFSVFTVDELRAIAGAS
jgi:hypothetical protein